MNIARYRHGIVVFLALLALGRAGQAQQAAPVASLPTVTRDGKALDIAHQPGWRVVYFWSASCPCVRTCETLSFVPLAEKYKGRVTFYAIESNHADWQMPAHDLALNIGQRSLPYPVLLDPGHRAADALGALVTPATFLLDPQGRVVFRGVPDDSREYKMRTGRPGVTRTYLADALAEALAGKPVSCPVVRSLGCSIDRSDRPVIL